MHYVSFSFLSIPCEILGQVIRKPIDANPGLKVNQRIYFPCPKMFFTSKSSCKLKLLKLKTEGQTI